MMLLDLDRSSAWRLKNWQGETEGSRKKAGAGEVSAGAGVGTGAAGASGGPGGRARQVARADTGARTVLCGGEGIKHSLRSKQEEWSGGREEESSGEQLAGRAEEGEGLQLDKAVALVLSSFVLRPSYAILGADVAYAATSVMAECAMQVHACYAVSGMI